MMALFRAKAGFVGPRSALSTHPKDEGARILVFCARPSFRSVFPLYKDSDIPIGRFPQFGQLALYCQLLDKGLVMKSEKISELTTNRLSVYLRCLNLLAAAGIKTISSQALADQFNLNSAQIRKDLAYFGEFGVRGVGYFVEELRRHITEILGLDTAHRVGIVGAGNLGTALANYNGFRQSNFEVVALFDNDKEKIGRGVGHAEITVYDVKRIE